MSRSGVRLAGSWAVQSLFFHRVRSVLTIAGIALATALVAGTLGFQAGFRTSLERNIDSMGYQVLVTGKGCPHEAATLILRGGSIPMYIHEDIYQHIIGRPEVQDATRFFMQSVPGKEPGSSSLYVGIDRSFLELKPGVRFQRGGWFSSLEADEAILGYNVAEYLRLSPGDTLEVQRRRLRVTGVLEKLGSQDDGTIFLPLSTAQSLFERRDRLTGIGIRLHDVSGAPAFVESLYEIPSIQVVRMAQVQSTMLRILEDVRGLLLGFGGLCLLVALMGVFNVGLITAHERTREMGILRALGCPWGRLFGLVWGESGLLAAAGVGAGLLLLVAMRGLIDAGLRGLLTYAPAGTVLTISPGLLAETAALVMALCLAAGLYPALRSARVPPLRTLRGAV